MHYSEPKGDVFMDRQRLLKRMRLKQNEMDDLLSKWQQFSKSLNPAQRKVMNASLPSKEMALKAFGSDCSENDLVDLFGKDEHSPRMLAPCVPEDCPPEGQNQQ
jgi:hypothetical protein